METLSSKISGINELIHAIQKTNQFFLDQTQRQVNTNLTLRNWVIGFYIVEYEQNGKDKAEYGLKLFGKITEKLKTCGLKSFSERHLYLCKDFYLAYPQILQSPTAKSYFTGFQDNRILRTVSAEFGKRDIQTGVQPTDPHLLLTRLSFTHLIELMKVETFLKRVFYETETIRNNWSVRELERAMSSMLFERTGLSKDKEAVLENQRKGSGLKPEDVFRNPYLLEFLELKEKPECVETDLEQAI